MQITQGLKRAAHVRPLFPSSSFRGRVRTWAETLARVQRLAGALHGLGVGAGDRVAILALNGLDYMETMVAAARLGLILVPLNVRLTPPELRYQLADSGSRLLLLGPEFASAQQEMAAGTALQVLPLGEPYEALVSGADGSAVDGRHPLETPQFIVYTSGTTGRPKGAILTQGNILANAVNNGMTLDITSRDVNLVVLPLFHVGGIGLFNTPTLYAGGTVVLPRRFDPAETMSLIERERVTLYLLVPTMHQAILPLMESGRYDTTSIRRVLSGGAPCPVELIERYTSLRLPIAQGYGMTETAPTVFLQPDREGPGKPGTIGMEAGFCDVRIQREDGSEAGVDEVGEITMKGPNLFAGYWNLPEATAASFDSEGWFHSGDLARRDGDCYVTIMGRKKDMIISGGENIYPLEVENLLLEHPAIAEAAVFPTPDPKWGETPRAAVVLKPGATVSEAELGQWLQSRLARYKQPKSIYFVDELPRNALGKVVKPELTKRYS